MVAGYGDAFAGGAGGGEGWGGEVVAECGAEGVVVGGGAVEEFGPAGEGFRGVGDVAVVVEGAGVADVWGEGRRKVVSGVWLWGREETGMFA